MPPASLAVSAPTPESPVAVASALRLGSAVPPGHYTLEVVVVDLLHPGKDGGAFQWLDFEVAE
jgi:hypothetical protein